MYSSISIKYCAGTNVGQCRENNEDNLIIGLGSGLANEYFYNNDSFIITETKFTVEKDLFFLAAVADGMGGTNAGEIASLLALKTVQERVNVAKSFPEGDNEKAHFFKSMILEAHKVIKDAGKRNPEQRGMGTTIVLVEIDSRGMTLVWSGDSRAYSLSPTSLVHPDRRLGLDRMELLTRDHSLVWDYVESGEITPEEARVHRMSHIITQSLGSDDTAPTPEVGFRNLMKGQRILLCSDGLNGMLTELQIENLLKQDGGLEAVVKDLINGANEAGGQDNISVIVLEIEQAVECETNNLNVIKNLTTANQILRKNGSFQLKQFLTVIFLFISIIFLIFFIFRYNDFTKFIDQFSIRQNSEDTSEVQMSKLKIESDLEGSTLSTNIVTLLKNEDSLRENVKQFENLVRESMTILKRNEENGARSKQFKKQENEEVLYSVTGALVKDSMGQMEGKFTSINLKDSSKLLKVMINEDSLRK